MTNPHPNGTCTLPGDSVAPCPPAVSVIVPTYNREKLLSVAVDSVLRQTFTDWELLLIDDRSTDGTRQAVESYARRDPRVKYYLNGRTKGPSGARNQGIELAAGEFVAFLDSDDEWEPHHLQEMVRYLRKYPGQIDVMSANPVRKLRSTGQVYGQAELDLGRFRHHRLEDACVFDPVRLFESALLYSPMTTQTIVMRRALLNRVRFDEDLLAGEDILFQLELAYGQAKVAHLPRIHVTYWAHGGNLTSPAGLGNPANMIPVSLAFETATSKVLEKFRLTPEQRRRIRDGLANLYCWHLGYHGFLKAGDFARARHYFWKSIQIKPFKLSYWKMYVSSFVRQLTASRGGLPTRHPDCGTGGAANGNARAH
jgi:glycosyltransferase involved in cell wall biosynthesis